MYAACLQDWTTIQSQTDAPITQSEPFWLDTSGFLDLVIFMETKNVSASNIFMAFQTAPTKDENLFLAMNDVSATGTPMSSNPSVPVQTFVLLRETALCPLCHWLRWQISTQGTGGYEATFRIWASLNQPGGVAYLSEVDPSAVNMQFEGSPGWTVGPATGGAAGGWNPVLGKHYPDALYPSPSHASVGHKKIERWNPVLGKHYPNAVTAAPSHIAGKKIVRLTPDERARSPHRTQNPKQPDAPVFGLNRFLPPGTTNKPTDK